MKTGRPIQHGISSVNEAEKVGDCAKCGRIQVELKERNGKLEWACKRKPPRLSKEEFVARMKARVYTKLQGREGTHLLSNVDESRREADCVLCGHVRIYEAKGARVRARGDAWVCGRRAPDGVGGKVKHVLTALDVDSKTAICALCGPVSIIWRPFTNGRGRWGCVFTKGSLGIEVWRPKDGFQPAICPYCDKPHRWDRHVGRRCRAALVQEHGPQCGICRIPFSETPRVDHDHETGRVRGLLCYKCNLGLGSFMDSSEKLQSAIDYLAKAKV